MRKKSLKRKIPIKSAKTKLIIREEAASYIRKLNLVDNSDRCREQRIIDEARDRINAIQANIDNPNSDTESLDSQWNDLKVQVEQLKTLNIETEANIVIDAGLKIVRRLLSLKLTREAIFLLEKLYSYDNTIAEVKIIQIEQFEDNLGLFIINLKKLIEIDPTHPKIPLFLKKLLDKNKTKLAKVLEYYLKVASGNKGLTKAIMFCLERLHNHESPTCQLIIIGDICQADEEDLINIAGNETIHNRIANRALVKAHIKLGNLDYASRICQQIRAINSEKNDENNGDYINLIIIEALRNNLKGIILWAGLLGTYSKSIPKEKIRLLYGAKIIAERYGKTEAAELLEEVYDNLTIGIIPGRPETTKDLIATYGENALTIVCDPINKED